VINQCFGANKIIETVMLPRHGHEDQIAEV